MLRKHVTDYCLVFGNCNYRGQTAQVRPCTRGIRPSLAKTPITESPLIFTLLECNRGHDCMDAGGRAKH